MTTQYKWLPSEPTPAMLEAEQFASSLAYESHEVQAVEVYKAIWQAAPEVEQKPVMYVEKGLICYTSLADDQSYLMSVDVSYLWEHGFPEGTKFYTHPQPKREPLSNRQIIEMVFNYPDYVDLARAIEQAHGIGETKCI
jgi:hypothetical protein